ncbi:hypothetical protein [Pectinatus haikarae]|uniref:Transcriptional regulator n=1 Tax=Pectinatus haikarae TaxID=349096 RepID=A0ABT9YBF1_9FIRM|nr:hypothetical protein [Pectinatus haikarae]MDQ0205173.1 putative transcriptional regulator [Pectinatus haikarae]
MGLFSFLFGFKKPKKTERFFKPEDSVPVNRISPNVVAAITAVIYTVMRERNPNGYFKITHISKIWTAAGRENLANSGDLSAKKKR